MYLIESQYEDKKTDLLRAGRDLFWKYGLRKVSIQEICQEAGVSRGTFYKYFDNKESLALHILELLIGKILTDYEQIMQEDLPFEDQMQKVIQKKLEFTDQLSMEMLNDLYTGQYPGLLAYMQKVSAENLKRIKQDFSQAQKKGYIRREVKIDYLIFMLNKMSELATLPELQSHYASSSELIKEMTTMFFRGILTQKK